MELKDLKVGQEVFICDYRYNDYDKKPIRKIPPTKVKVFSNYDLPKNKRVYYSNIHFRPINEKGKILSRIIAPFDNTGYRSITGTCVNIASTIEECNIFYDGQIDNIKTDMAIAKKNAVKRYDSILREINEEWS